MDDQSFQYYSPRVNLTMPIDWDQQYNYSDILFKGAGRRKLLRLLTIPVLPQASSTSFLATADRCPPTSLPGLPIELLHQVFADVSDTDIYDALCLAVTHRKLWAVGRESVQRYCMSRLGGWAGKHVICVGNKIESHDWPRDYFTDDEWEKTEPIKHMQVSLATYAFHAFAGEELDEPLADRCTAITGFVENMKKKKKKKQAEETTAVVATVLDDIEQHVLCAKEYYPVDQPWILRNHTLSVFVRADAIAIAPEHIHGPSIDVMGFAEVLAARTGWSGRREAHVPLVCFRGVWAGHCFDVTTMGCHRRDTRGSQAAQWQDVSDEVAAELAGLWEKEYGPDWRRVAVDLWAEKNSSLEQFLY